MDDNVNNENYVTDEDTMLADQLMELLKQIKRYPDKIPHEKYCREKYHLVFEIIYRQCWEFLKRQVDIMTSKFKNAQIDINNLDKMNCVETKAFRDYLYYLNKLKDTAPGEDTELFELKEKLKAIEFVDYMEKLQESSKIPTTYHS